VPLSQVTVLTLTTTHEERLLGVCSPAGAAPVLEFTDEATEQAYIEEFGQEPCVLLDADGFIHLTKPDEVFALSQWLAQAAMWLRSQHFHSGEK
jgi:hypothetical protein